MRRRFIDVGSRNQRNNREMLNGEKKYPATVPAIRTTEASLRNRSTGVSVAGEAIHVTGVMR